jgi:hypothetical protein
MQTVYEGGLETYNKWSGDAVELGGAKIITEGKTSHDGLPEHAVSYISFYGQDKAIGHWESDKLKANKPNKGKGYFYAHWIEALPKFTDSILVDGSKYVITGKTFTNSRGDIIAEYSNGKEFIKLDSKDERFNQ